MSTIEGQMAEILADEIAKEIDMEVMLSVISHWPADLYSPKMSGMSGPDLPYGWAGELTYPNVTDFNDHIAMYYGMVSWINEMILNPKQNACWNKIGDCIYVMFRKEKDMSWFVTRWGS